MNVTTEAIPVAYVCFGFLSACLLLAVVPFIALAIYSREEISLEYDTVSSFCANPAKPGNRFLLVQCCFIGLSLALLYCDEYNSLLKASTADNWRFALRFSSACVMPLVGIFYTRNKLAVDPQYYDCGFTSFPLIVSDVLHSVCALYFLLTSAACALWGALVLRSDGLFMGAVFATLLLACFLGIQMQLRVMAPVVSLQYLYVASFTLEFCAIFGSILMNVFVSLVANTHLAIHG